ncbi:reticulon-4-interacting protein 1, mitochondrial-like [Neodiprion virginianus]|uniref:reticulon-4-interacting protein 1, mitochondrial-like n=1 Tax=Neodiprion virginianus TaxID=2961670 RepID=UPI001EE71418|nr:reticulon-4-interacting protein 1, mitochondrial-like [Neodiprion virginianus]
MMFVLRITTIGARPVVRCSRIRCLSQLSRRYKENSETKMQAWQIHSYGGLSDLKLSEVRIPIIRKPGDVLIKVEASSINPIDISMSRGFGATIFNALRKIKAMKLDFDGQIEFPLTLGRDFCGVVVSKGLDVGDRLKLGEEVWGVVPLEEQGCHAEYVVVDSKLVNPRPQNLSYTEASSILYAGLTAWSALWITGGLSCKVNIPTYQNKRILVLGASGGVGTLAIQLLKAWNMQVVATCSTDAVELVEQLGAHVVIDYNDQRADTKIAEEGPYDIILDCCKQGIHTVRAKGYSYNTYITLNSPMLKNFDDFGVIGGSVKNIGDVIKDNVPFFKDKTSVKWGFFVPSQKGINMIQNFVEKKKIVPVIEKVYPFSELPQAYERVDKGHLRGKIVIDMK